MHYPCKSAGQKINFMPIQYMYHLTGKCDKKYPLTIYMEVVFSGEGGQKG